jgi:hypothetical protein
MALEYQYSDTNRIVSDERTNPAKYNSAPRFLVLIVQTVLLKGQ